MLKITVYFAHDSCLTVRSDWSVVSCGASACPAPQTESCIVDCIYEWGAWSECNPASGMKTRRAFVSQQALNGE